MFSPDQLYFSLCSTSNFPQHISDKPLRLFDIFAVNFTLTKLSNPNLTSLTQNVKPSLVNGTDMIGSHMSHMRGLLISIIYKTYHKVS